MLLGLSHRTALREFWSAVVTLHDCMHACDAAYRDECAGSLGGGTIERFLGLSVRIKPHALTVPCDLFPSWASGAADEDAGEKAK